MTAQDIFPINSPEQNAIFQARLKFPKGKLHGVYICWEFPPITSPAAACVSRRLSELRVLLDYDIDWTVLTPEKSYDYLPQTNERYAELFAEKQYSRIIRVGDYGIWNSTFDDRWLTGMLEALVNLNKEQVIDLVCSRSHPAILHKIAMTYAQNFEMHCQPFWIAEFSDVFTQNMDNQYIGDESCFDTTIAEFELDVYRNANIIVLNNKNQSQLTFSNMRKHLCDDNNISEYKRKTVILQHPILAHDWCSAVQSPYVDSINRNKINVAYFGVWMYKQRSANVMSKLSEYPDIELHYFMPSQYRSEYTNNAHNIHQNEPVDTLEMLNIADNMDYLYVEDSLFAGSINPYLPNKLADYLSTETLIIARVQSGSTMDGIDNARIIKIYDESDVTEEFVEYLRSRVGKT